MPKIVNAPAFCNRRPSESSLEPGGVQPMARGRHEQRRIGIPIDRQRPHNRQDPISGKTWCRNGTFSPTMRAIATTMPPAMVRSDQPARWRRLVFLVVDPVDLAVLGTRLTAAGATLGLLAAVIGLHR
jgi:hypothetical protein